MKRTSLFQGGARAALMGVVLGVGTGQAMAQITVTNWFAGVNRVIPDGQITGMAETRVLNFTNAGFFEITHVELTLSITGGYNGDLYGYLVHDSGFSVLFNRAGRTTSNRPGYSQCGFDITIADGGKDLHFYQNFAFDLNANGQLTGTWAPDGRQADPAAVNEHASPTALLASFNGLTPNGTWTLFLADMDYGEQATLVDWSVAITAVPEPSGYVLLGFGIMIGLWRLRGQNGFAQKETKETKETKTL